MRKPAESIDTYRQAVKRLTDEKKALQVELAEARRAHKQEVRKLRAQISEGVSAELVVARRELGRWKQRAQAAEQRLAEKRRNVR